MTVTFSSLPVNEAFARMAVSAFIMPLDPTVSEITDIKTAVSEAVTNSIIHGYDGLSGDIVLLCSYEGREIYIEISDRGRGIDDVARAVEPFFTTREDEERSGMGFTIMQTFMTAFSVRSKRGEGTTVTMSKRFGAANDMQGKAADAL